MIALIDPAVFVAPPGTEKLDGSEDEALRTRVEGAHRVLRELVKNRSARIATRRIDVHSEDASATIEVDSWGKLQRAHIRPLSRRLSVETQQSVYLLRELITRHGVLIPKRAERRGRCYGVNALFSPRYMDEALCDEWSKLLCSATGEGDEVVVVSTLVLGRNAANRSSEDGTELVERTRWRVYAHLQEYAPVAIDVLVHTRNIDERWTTRFDPRLPRSGPCPFCVPRDWHQRGTVVWKTLESKPCWIDSNGLGWARPRTGGGYHWDVFLKNNTVIREEAGVDQVNVVQHDAPSAQGVAGAIHHAGDKKGRLNEALSWSRASQL
jgi:hypothetical protein